MTKNSLKTSYPVVVPMETLRSANTFVAREANRSAIPFVSLEQLQPTETGIKPGNTGESLSVPIIVPEHNCGYPDLFKSLLEKNPVHQLRRVIGICDLSPGCSVARACLKLCCR